MSPCDRSLNWCAAEVRRLRVVLQRLERAHGQVTANEMHCHKLGDNDFVESDSLYHSAEQALKLHQQSRARVRLHRDARSRTAVATADDVGNDGACSEDGDLAQLSLDKNTA